MNITIPRTIEAAKKALLEVGSLLTAKQWERAAIVYAFTDPDFSTRFGTENRTRNPGKVNYKTFAELGIVGLNRPGTVATYRNAWAEAIKDGAVEAEPGKIVTLPTREFPDNPESAAGTVRSFKAAVKRDPQVIREIVQDDPEALEAVAEAVSQHPGVTLRATEKVEARRQTRDPKPAGPKYWDQATNEVIRDLEAAMVRVHALVENRSQLDEFELRRLTESLSAQSVNLSRYLADTMESYSLFLKPVEELA